MKSGHSVIGFGCGRCGGTLAGKIKDEYVHIKPGTRAFDELLYNPNNFKLFGCLSCGTESPNIQDLTALTAELKLKQLLSSKTDLERSIPFYEQAIPKMREELAHIEAKLPEVLKKVAERRKV